MALEAREKSKAVRSGYKVGACLVGEDDRGITCYLPGYNIELSGYPPIHAEHMAYIVGEFYQLQKHYAIVVACDGGYPMCGICRQLWINVNPSMRVIGVNTAKSSPEKVVDTTLDKLLPLPYPTWRSGHENHYDIGTQEQDESHS